MACVVPAQCLSAGANQGMRLDRAAQCGTGCARRARVLVVGLAVLLAFCLVVARLVLQVVRHEDLAEQAESNRTAVLPVVPNREFYRIAMAWKATKLCRLYAGDHTLQGRGAGRNHPGAVHSRHPRP